jgi:hypothetical protein
MRRLRLHDPPGYMLNLAAVLAVMGFGLMGYEGTRFGDGADPWRHFWFCLGVGIVGVAIGVTVASVVLFIKEQRHPQEQELASMEQSTSRESAAATGEIEEGTEIKRRFR